MANTPDDTPFPHDGPMQRQSRERAYNDLGRAVCPKCNAPMTLLPGGPRGGYYACMCPRERRKAA